MYVGTYILNMNLRFGMSLWNWSELLFGQFKILIRNILTALASEDAIEKYRLQR